MKIVVCIKQVPDTTEVKLDPKTGTLIRDGVPSIMNPDDKAGLALALRLKRENGAHVTALAMGPKQAGTMMREALAMGADRAVLLCDKAFAGSDTLATSSVLAAAIAKLGFDLVVTGRQAIDGDTAQVGPQIAEHLGIPNVSYAQKLVMEENSVRVQRQFESCYQTQRVHFPCLITALGGLEQALYMRPGNIFAAYLEQEVEVWGAGDIEIDPARLGLAGSPTQVKKSFPKQTKPAGTVQQLEGLEAAKSIVQYLQNNFII